MYALRRADAYAAAGVESPGAIVSLIDRVDGVLARDNALSLRDLAVSGRDLMGIGVKSGKRMGIILRELLEAALEDPALNTREKLLEIAGKLNERYGTGSG
jgi:hypothetical protein